MTLFAVAHGATTSRIGNRLGGPLRRFPDQFAGPIHESLSDFGGRQPATFLLVLTSLAGQLSVKSGFGTITSVATARLGSRIHSLHEPA